MSLTKRVKGDYIIENVGSTDTLTIKSKSISLQGLDGDTGVNTIVINGDLQVKGNTNTISTTDTSIQDQFVVLNSGETGAGITFGTAGINVDRGTSPLVGVRYNETGTRWEATDDGTIWYALSSTAAGTLTAIVQDTTPQLGGNLDVNGFQITSATNGDIVIVANGTGLVKLNQELSLINKVSDPAALAGYNKVYAKTPGFGGSGLYVSNSTTVDEVASFKKAFILSIIF